MQNSERAFPGEDGRLRRFDIVRVLADWERFTTEPVEIRGVPIPANETVQCMLGAANRDPAHFEDPDCFDPQRPNARDHLSFGAGRHFCLGATLARMEAKEAIARVLGLPGLRLDPERPSRPHGHEFRAPPGVWVVWDLGTVSELTGSPKDKWKHAIGDRA